MGAGERGINAIVAGNWENLKENHSFNTYALEFQYSSYPYDPELPSQKHPEHVY